MSSVNVTNGNSTFGHNPNHQLENVNQQRKKRNVTNKRIQNNCRGFKKYSAPVFNIHVHVPHFETNSASVYIPPIQPVVHIHFDDFVRKIHFNKNPVNLGALKKAVKNMLKTSQPTLGEVKLHFHRKLQPINKETVQNIDPMPSTSQKIIHDTTKNLNNAIGKVQRPYSIVPNTNSVYTVQENNDDHNYSQRNCFKHWFDKDKKLKNAVVVLKDIRKDEYYKRLLDSRQPNDSILIKNNENNILNNNQNGLNYVIAIKKEPNTDELENNGQCSENKVINNFDEIKYQKPSTVTDLADGCDFSEILYRFKVGKNYKKDVESKCDEPEHNFECGMIKREETISNEINSNHLNGLNTLHGNLNEKENSLGRNYELEGHQNSNDSFLSSFNDNESQGFCNPYFSSDTSSCSPKLLIKEETDF